MRRIARQLDRHGRARKTDDERPFGFERIERGIEMCGKTGVKSHSQAFEKLARLRARAALIPSGGVGATIGAGPLAGKSAIDHRPAHNPRMSRFSWTWIPSSGLPIQAAIAPATLSAAIERY